MQAVIRSKKMHQEASRVLSFPQGRSVGQLFAVYQEEEIYLGEAQGRISVPYDDEILLVVRERPSTGLDFLEDFNADDLWGLTLRDKNLRLSDLEHIQYLSGLQSLDLGRMTLADNYVDYLYPLAGLTELDLSGAAVGRSQIEALTDLPWLKLLRLGFLEKSQEREGWTWRDIRNALPELNIRYGLMDVCERWTRFATEIDAEFTPPITYDATNLIVPGPTLDKRYKNWSIQIGCSYDTTSGDVILKVESRFNPIKSVKMSFGMEDASYRPNWERNIVGLYTSIAQAVGNKRKVKTGIGTVDGGSDYQVRASDPQIMQMILAVEPISSILLRPDVVGDKFKFWTWGVNSDATKETVSSVQFVNQMSFLEFPRITSAKLRRIISLVEDTLDQLVKIGVASN
jgi:hypothetical protein